MPTPVLPKKLVYMETPGDKYSNGGRSNKCLYPARKIFFSSASKMKEYSSEI